MFKKNIRQHLALFVAFCMILNFSVPTFAAENGDESDAYDVVDNLDLLDETGEIDEFDETDETGETDETNEDFDLEENLDEELEEDLEELEEEELDPIVISNVTGDNLVVTSADGEVVVIDNERPLQAGDVVSVGSGTRVALQLYTDGPQVLLDSQSNVTLGDGLVPPNLTINSGSVMVNALAGGFPILEVMIGDELVTISGGLFVVEVAEDGTTNVTMLAGSGFINGFPLEPGQVMTLSWDLLEELETLTPEVDLDLDIAEDQDLDNAEDTEESEENLEDLEELEELTEAAVLVFFLNMQVSELDLSTVSLFVLQTIIDFWEVLVEWGVVADDEELYTSIVDRVEELEREAEEAANGGNGGNGDGNVVVRPPQPEIDNETEGDISPPPSAGGGGNGGGNGGQTPEPPRYEEPPEVDGVRQISSTLHLNWLAYHDVSGMDFILMNRIDAGSMVLPLLDGDFNGNNNVIEVGGITNTTASALFGTVTANGTVRDLHVNGSISGGVEGFPAAGIAAFNEGTLDNVFFNGSITGYGGLAGGLVGVARAGSEVLRSGFNGSIASSNGSLGLTTGGIVGNLETGATVSETFVIGTVHIHAFPGAPGNVGGIAGINAGDINNSYSTAQVGGGGNAGGLVGLNNGTLTTSYTVGAVNGGNNTGGLVGLNNGSVSLSIALNPTVDGGLNTNAAVGSGNAATLIFVHPDIRVNGETVNGGNGNGNGGNGNGNGENGNGNGENGNGNGENGNGNGGNGNGNGENGNGNGENGNGNGENGNGNGENGNGNGEN
ncbi:MAG: hypothetical protein FWG64_10390, partial [Firmicutes bacterium]|nr:hypothetical protein [Bacillota bacterium]